MESASPRPSSYPIHRAAEKTQILGKPYSYARIHIRYRGVSKRNFTCSPNHREEFFSETSGIEGSNLAHTYSCIGMR